MNSLKDTTEAFDDFKNKQKEWMNKCSWYLKVHIFWKFVKHIMHWDKTQILKKIPTYKINVIKNALFFLSRAPTHHSFTFYFYFLFLTFYLQLLCELKHKVRHSKILCGIFHFRFCLVFIKVYIFVQQKA